MRYYDTTCTLTETLELSLTPALLKERDDCDAVIIRVSKKKLQTNNHYQQYFQKYKSLV